jgi:hypothetical protein
MKIELLFVQKHSKCKIYVSISHVTKCITCLVFKSGCGVTRLCLLPMIEQTGLNLVVIKRDVIVKEMQMITFKCHVSIVKYAKLLPLTSIQVS